MIVKLLHIIIFGYLTIGLASCHLGKPVNVSVNRYTVNQLPRHVKLSQKRLNENCLISRPETQVYLDSKKMAYIYSPHQLQYYQYNIWAASPSDMFQSGLVNTLRRARFCRAILTPPTVSAYGYVLKTNIEQFETVFKLNAAYFRFTLSTQLTNIKSARVIASFSKTISQPILQQTSPQAIAKAANKANSRMLTYMLAHLDQVNLP